MPRRPLPRPCLDCGTLTTQTRCPTHTRANRPPPNPAYSDPHYQRIRKQRIESHIVQHGWHCPGYEVPPHPSRDLTLDHTIPLSAGGTNHPTNLGGVLCRACNTRKGGTNREGGDR